MVAVVENRTAVVGVVRAIRPEGDRVHLDLEVEDSRPVAGMPDLLTEQHPVGSTCRVGAPAADVPEGVVVGTRLSAHLRLAGPGVVALAVDPPPLVVPGRRTSRSRKRGGR